MAKKSRIALAVLGVVLLICVGVVAWFFFAVHHVPRFYEDAVQIEPKQRKVGSDELLRRSAALASDVNKKKPWQTIFTADQINGWLAVDLVENHPDLLPPEFHDPRVAIHSRQVIVGCKYDSDQISSVVSLEAEVTLQAPNVIAARILRARAGAVPLPLDRILPKLAHALETVGCQVELRQVEADPVLIVGLPANIGNRSRVLPVLEKMELREGELFISGESK